MDSVKMSLSITTDIFNYTFKPSISEKLPIFKENGFDYIHWCDNWDDEALYSHDLMQKYADLLADSGVLCLDVHGTATKAVSIDAVDPRNQRAYIKLLENRLQFCYNVGGDAVVVHPPKYHEPNLEKRMAQSHKVIKAVENLCIDKSLRLAFENCSRDDHLILMEYFEQYSPEFMGFCFDSGHANLHKNLDEVMKFGDRLFVTHLHDNKGVSDDHQQPGWGSVDWSKVSKWLKRIKLRKPWNLEVTHNGEYFSGFMDEYMKTVCEASRTHLMV
ncbi:sugar phosphate isomerase/epimerase [Candidatus Bathyarchaeota archaeon]|nr:sugar phosphate isomerase/epimerase [Candidatus Bathyarchaeota archaeon]